MFSLSKILALAAILGAVWYGFKLIGRLDEARRRKVDRPDRDQAGPSRTGPTRADPGRGDPPADDVLDLVKDDKGSYVAKEKRDDRV